MSVSNKRILFQLTGSIACYKACFVISKLVQEGYEVQAVCSKRALEFVGEATLVGLTARPIFSDVFESGRQMDHINLAKWASLSIVAPATANCINSLASGIAHDAIGTLFLAHDFKKPYLLAPAMNQEMFKHPLTQKSLHILNEIGVKVLDTDYGKQACGDIGYGRLLNPDELYNEIVKQNEMRWT